MHCRDAGASVVVRGAVISGFMSRQIELWYQSGVTLKSSRRKSNACVWVSLPESLQQPETGSVSGKGTFLFKAFQQIIKDDDY